MARDGSELIYADVAQCFYDEMKLSDENKDAKEAG